MDELFRKLENESLLLIYLAGEMPDVDRMELEALLQVDGGLRAQLEAIRETWETSISAIEILDSSEPLTSTERSVREVSRAMRQWHVDRLARPTQAPAQRRRFPYLIYSTATAAVLLVGFCTWWGLRPDLGGANFQQPLPMRVSVADNSSSTTGNPPDQVANQQDTNQSGGNQPGGNQAGENQAGENQAGPNEPGANAVAMNQTAGNQTAGNQNTASLPGSNGVADGRRQPFTLVSLDPSSQRLADLEQAVSEDLH